MKNSISIGRLELNLEGSSEQIRLFKEIDDEDAKASDKRRLLIAVLFSMSLLQSLYMNLAAFFPNYAEDNYPWI